MSARTTATGTHAANPVKLSLKKETLKDLDTRADDVKGGVCANSLAGCTNSIGG